MMPSLPVVLFAYGTLRPAAASAASWPLVERLTCLGPATMSGRLYDLGGYPGMVAGGGTVHGDLLVVRQAAELAALDAYEECGGPQPLFRRTPAQAVRSDGVIEDVWVYLYARPVGNAPPIPDGIFRPAGGRSPPLPTPEG